MVRKEGAPGLGMSPELQKLVLECDVLCPLPEQCGGQIPAPVWEVMKWE